VEAWRPWAQRIRLRPRCGRQHGSRPNGPGSGTVARTVSCDSPISPSSGPRGVDGRSEQPPGDAGRLGPCAAPMGELRRGVRPEDSTYSGILSRLEEYFPPDHSRHVGRFRVVGEPDDGNRRIIVRGTRSAEERVEEKLFSGLDYCRSTGLSDPMQRPPPAPRSSGFSLSRFPTPRATGVGLQERRPFSMTSPAGRG